MSSRVFRGAFEGPLDEVSGRGVRPVIFDIIGPDGVTSLLPEGLRMVLHVNPSEMKFTYSKVTERVQTLGGWVEQHFGEAVDSISCSASSGGFMRLYVGLSGITGGPGSIDLGGTRRDTLAYDAYLDMMALFHHNGGLYDSRGMPVYHGQVKCSFDGGVWLGWFSEFSVEESADQPYQFKLSWGFTVAHELMSYRTQQVRAEDNVSMENPLESQLVEAEALRQERESENQSSLLRNEPGPTGTTQGIITDEDRDFILNGVV